MSNYKPKIFLAPVSSSYLFQNYQKTVMVGFEKDKFLRFKNASHYSKLLTNSPTIRIWGIKSVKLTPYNKASINDYVLFYHKGKMIGKAIISFKDNNKNLSEELWGYDFDNLRNEFEYWENIVFLEKFTEINLNFKILIEYASYSPKAIVRGFNEYSKSGIERIINEHKTVDIFLKKYE